MHLSAFVYCEQSNLFLLSTVSIPRLQLHVDTMSSHGKRSKSGFKHRDFGHIINMINYETHVVIQMNAGEFILPSISI
jgi:hypothetical protein